MSCKTSKLTLASAIAALALGSTSEMAIGDRSAIDPITEYKAIPGDTDWLMYNRTYGGDRYSELTQINEHNVQMLREVCRVKAGELRPFQTAPLLVDGILYITATRATIALDPANCEIIWKALYAPEGKEAWPANRGLGYADGRLFRGTPDGRLVAYEAKTGRELWRTLIANSEAGERPSAAPIVWDNIVFMGIGGGDYGNVGRMMAFDAATGRKLWSFNTVPQEGEFGNDTWAGDSSKRGGGGTWSSYALDPQSGELFVPVANPAPDANPQVRRGANLFTNSVLVLDAKTGIRRWHFQTLKSDSHDYGIAAPPSLVTLPTGRRAVVLASKDGNLYVIDRETHKLVYKTAITTLANSEVDPTPQGVMTCPGVNGGTEWNSPAYDPVNRLLIAGAIDWCALYKVKPITEHKLGDYYWGGSYELQPKGSGWFTAVDAATGKVRWKVNADAPVVAAITPTAGGITFVGDMAGRFYALRSRDGGQLYRVDTGGAVAGGIITYMRSGTQYVAVTSGNVSRVSFGASGTPSLILYALADRVTPAGQQPSTWHPETGPMTAEPNSGRGASTYAQICAACHGTAGEGGVGPTLKGISMRYSASETIQLIKNPRSVMPRLFPDNLSEQQVVDVAAFVRSLN